MWAMHDWISVSASLVWEKAELTLVLDPYNLDLYPPGTGQVALIAQGISLFHCPRKNDWGPSVHILDANLEDVGSHKRLAIKMQTGDIIEIVAHAFVLPAGTGLPKAPERAS